ncbi:hypothetical protein CCACVL1_04592 [Corchorus capsularis]|uniref:Uncharacterized protein n=1 Tax=Corchorus capsularis TaxID=210143 RepID=A0A1R3JR16_COCAP|nr:hypothetical protein CCACVL1_04592 [Corchorus capsularis]
MAIYGVGTLGLIPITLAACGNNASCTAELNRISALFNDKLKPVVQQLNTNLTDAKFTYLNPAPTEADIAASGTSPAIRRSNSAYGNGIETTNI